MSISLTGDAKGPGLPVVKRTALGQVFTGALVKFEQRNILKDGQPIPKDNGKFRQELVVTCLTMPGTTAPAGIGEHTATAQPGDLVRLILRGGAFGQWIEAAKVLNPLQVGDVITQVTEWGQAYNAAGAPAGAKLTTQAQVDAVPRSQTLGIYGPLTIRRATATELDWVTRAETAHVELRDAVLVPAANVVGDWADEAPF